MFKDMYAISIDGQFTNLVISVTQFLLSTILVFYVKSEQFSHFVYGLYDALLAEQRDPKYSISKSFRLPLTISSKNILGSRDFRNVYKGCLQDGTLVVVKRLKDDNVAGREVQFQTEVEMINLVVHRNLLRLCGFCMTST